MYLAQFHMFVLKNVLEMSGGADSHTGTDTMADRPHIVGNKSNSVSVSSRVEIKTKTDLEFYFIFSLNCVTASHENRR